MRIRHKIIQESSVSIWEHRAQESLRGVPGSTQKRLESAGDHQKGSGEHLGALRRVRGVSGSTTEGPGSVEKHPNVKFARPFLVLPDTLRSHLGAPQCFPDPLGCSPTLPGPIRVLPDAPWTLGVLPDTQRSLTGAPSRSRALVDAPRSLQDAYLHSPDSSEYFSEPH